MLNLAAAPFGARKFRQEKSRQETNFVRWQRLRNGYTGAKNYNTFWGVEKGRDVFFFRVGGENDFDMQ